MNMDTHSGTEHSRRPRDERQGGSGSSPRRRPRYAKNSYQPRFYNDSTKPTPHRRRRRRRRSRGPQKLIILGVCSVLLLIISLVLLIRSCVNYNPLVGRWSVDSMTSYVFYEEGVGAMVVPRGRYAFTYTMEDDTLFIDFEDEKALDSTFEYEKDGDTLTLIGGNEDNRGTYVLQLQE